MFRKMSYFNRLKRNCINLIVIQVKNHSVWPWHFFSRYLGKERGKALPRLLLALIGPYVKAEGYLQEGRRLPHHTSLRILVKLMRSRPFFDENISNKKRKIGT